MGQDAGDLISRKVNRLPAAIAKLPRYQGNSLQSASRIRWRFARMRVGEASALTIHRDRFSEQFDERVVVWRCGDELPSGLSLRVEGSRDEPRASDYGWRRAWRRSAGQATPPRRGTRRFTNRHSATHLSALRW